MLTHSDGSSYTTEKSACLSFFAPVFNPYLLIALFYSVYGVLFSSLPPIYLRSLDSLQYNLAQNEGNKRGFVSKWLWIL